MKVEIHPHGSVVSSIRMSIIGVFVGLLGGIWLQYMQEDLILITPLLIALPAMSAMAGDLASIITGHISDPESTIATRKKLLKSLLLIVPFNAVAVVSLSLFFAYLQDYEPTREFIYTYGSFVIGIFFIITSITVGISIFMRRTLHEERKNSDDVLIPVANVTATLVMILAISAAVWALF